MLGLASGQRARGLAEVWQETVLDEQDATVLVLRRGGAAVALLRHLACAFTLPDTRKKKCTVASLAHVQGAPRLCQKRHHFAKS